MEVFNRRNIKIINNEDEVLFEVKYPPKLDSDIIEIINYAADIIPFGKLDNPYYIKLLEELLVESFDIIASPIPVDNIIRRGNESNKCLRCKGAGVIRVTDTAGDRENIGCPLCNKDAAIYD